MIDNELINLNGRSIPTRTWRKYAAEVRRVAFPGPEHTYSIDEDELDDFRRRWHVAER